MRDESVRVVNGAFRMTLLKGGGGDLGERLTLCRSRVVDDMIWAAYQCHAVWAVESELEGSLNNYF